MKPFTVPTKQHVKDHMRMTADEIRAVLQGSVQRSNYKMIETAGLQGHHSVDTRFRGFSLLIYIDWFNFLCRRLTLFTLELLH